MGSISNHASFVVESYVNQHGDELKSQVLKLRTGSSETRVFVLLSTEESTPKTRTTIERLYNDLRKKMASESDKSSLDVPRIWALLESVAGDRISRAEAELIEEMLAQRSSKLSIEEEVILIIASVLQLSPRKVRQSASFTRIGGTAHSALEVQDRCFNHGILLSISDILYEKTLGEVAQSACMLLKNGGAHTTSTSAKTSAAREILPVQHAAEVDIVAATKYWDEQLKQVAPAIFPSPASDYKRAEATTTIAATSEAAGLSATHTLLQAAWAIVLGRYNDSSDVRFDASVLIPKVKSSEVDSACALPMRVSLDGQTPVSEFLGQISRRYHEMSLFAEHGRKHISALDKDACESLPTTALIINSTETALEPATHALVINATIADFGIDLKFTYNSNSIAELQCTALAQQLKHVIQQLSTFDSELVESVSIAGPWDFKQALEWNGPPMPVYHQCLHHLITDRAMRDPEREAIYTVESSMTYSALEEESGLLASHIVSLGIPPKTIVPICFSPSKWAVVAMLGVMKAGCSFLPLDPSHPESRRQGIMAQVGADIIIGSPKTAALCEKMCANAIILDDLFIAEKIQEGKLVNIPMRLCSPTDVAYTLFTSGSTGVPKGVQVEHTAAASSIINFTKKLGATEEMRFLSFASYAFDACIYEIFCPLVLGGAVCIPPEERRFENMSPFLAEARVTIALLTPSYVKTLDPEQLPTIETLLIGGEAATLDIIQNWKSHVRLVNCYGPTETCVMVTMSTYEAEIEHTTPTRIGTPVHGNCWLVEPDDHNQLTPIGCTGEIMVQSHAMAREYYKQPDKTAASFVSNVEFFPDSTAMRAARCYKTGDLAKYNPDGTLEYQGRKDNQIKLRGQRLEPGEIEVVLNLADDRIKNSAVHLTKRKAGNALVAFIDLTEPLDASVVDVLGKHDLIPIHPPMEELLANLRSEVAARLPKFMVPSFFVPLNEMPFSTSMKTDRKALQGLADSLTIEELSKYSAASSGAEAVAPNSPEEALMRDLWAQILNTDPGTISCDSSFLHVGGDSISAIHLSSLARKNGFDLSTAAIFKDSRLSVMAQVPRVAVDTRDDSHAGIKPFSILKSSNVGKTVSELRSACRLTEGAVIDDAFPCTPLQEGLLALGVKHPGSYIAKFVYRLSDDIDIVQFKASWEHLADTCENMRVRIVQLGADSIQTLVRGDFAWEPTANMSLHKFLEVAQNMNMSYGSKLSRAALIKEASGKKYFVWVTHHAVFDGWTVMLVLNALKELYQGTSTPSFVPYRGFVKYASSLDMSKAQAYWKKQLRGAQAPAFPERQLNSTTTDPSRKVSRIMKHDIPFPASTKTAITKGTILRAAWAMTLGRYGNTDDVCFGATASGRNADVDGIPNMTGAVIGTVPIRIRIDPRKSIRNFLADIQEQALEMVQYEQFGFQNIAKISAEAKAASDVTSLLIVQPQQQVEAVGTSTAAFMRSATVDEYSVVDAIEGYFTFPIVLQCLVNAGHVTLDFTYDSSVVCEAQMAAMCQHLGNIVNQLLLQDDSKLGDIAVAGSWDLEKATSFNSHIREVVADTCLHDIIGQRIAESPDDQAVYSTDLCMTYRELDHFSSLLACHLMELGVTLETVVPICFEKSAWTVIAMLGIMKAGGVFMPMDPTHPYERRKALIEQLNAQYVLTSVESAYSCEDIADNVTVLSKTLLDELMSTMNVASASFKSEPSSAAYILFTSGSTGQPKGIVVEHKAISSSMISHGREFGLSKSSRVLQFASYVFDVSVSEILTTLVYGGTVCVPSGTERMQDIAGFINKAKADVAMLTPSFVTTFSPKDVPGLKVLILGGEAPTKITLSTWQPHVRLLNGYAPAECCIYALTHDYQSISEIPTVLGKGIHTNCWIVEPEDHNRLAPIGCVGELVIQGNTIGRGYVNDPEKTAKAFLDKLDCVPARLHKANHRYYKSGDLVKYDVNGDIEYLGRKDTQVKLRGQRIELGEIEYNIQQSLKDAKYVTVEVVKRGQREALVAFISFVDTENDSCEELLDDNSNMLRENTPAIKRSFENLSAILKAKIPPFMVPSLFMALRRTPFLSSMKVNRKVLRGMVDSMSANEYSQLSIAKSEDTGSPLSDMEISFRGMWAEILGISPELIGKNDSFFQVGGDSISALELSSLAQKQGILVSMAKLFANPTLQAMAEAATQDETAFVPALPFELLDSTNASKLIRDACQQCGLRNIREVEDVFPCTAFQEGLVALSVRQPGAYVSTVVYRLAAGTSVLKFKSAWERTVERCSNLRTRVVIPSNSSDGKAFQVITGFKPSWESTEGYSLASFVNASKKNHMGYGSALCRYALLEVEQPYFILTIHHATYDLWSMNLILSVLREAYDGAEELQLLPYANFLKYLMSTDIAQTQQFWTRQLEGVKPTTFPRLPAEQKKTKATMRERITKVALPSATKTNITRATLLQAAWSIVLARHSESDDVCYGTTVTGRLAHLSGITSMIGPTITTVPLRCKVDRTTPVSEFLSQVQARTTSMIPHEQYGLLNISKLSDDAKTACDFSTLLIIQPINQVMARSQDALLEEDTSEATTKLLEDSLQSYFDNPLVVNCLLSEDSVELVIYYDSNILSESSLEALEHHFGCVTEQLLRQDETPIGSLSMVDRWDVSLAVNSQAVPEAYQSCTHWLVEKQMETRAWELAVSAWDGELSYSQLGMAAAELASRLRGHGVGSGDLVLTVIGQSKWFAVAFLAIQLAGAAIVPVEPSTMIASHQAILQIVKPKLILTTSRLESSLIVSDISAIFVDSAKSGSTKSLATIIPSQPSPQGLSMVVLTDENSEAPNGIKFTHSAVASSIMAYIATIRLDHTTRMLQRSPAGSSLSVIETIATLAAGGCVCIPEKSVHYNNISKTMVQLETNSALLTPTLLEALQPDEVPSLKLIGLNGAISNKTLLDTWSHAADIHTLFATEESLICATKQYTSAITDIIGKPLSAAFWVIEDSEPPTLTPLGCMGELVIEGPSIASGYLNEESSVADKFIEDLDCLPGNAIRRVLRTGDLVRRNFDGSFEYIGRKESARDGLGSQMDIFNAEAQLRKGLPESMDGTVAALDNDNSKALVGLIWNAQKDNTGTSTIAVVEQPSAELTEKLLEIQSLLMTSLPKYLIPTSFLLFNGSPSQLASGRYNRREIIMIANQVPAEQRIQVNPGKVTREPPVTPTEIRLRDLWAALLSIPPNEIGRNDSFLNIGGDSISAIQLVTMARSQGLGLTIASIFKDPRLSEVAASAVVNDEDDKDSLEPFTLLPNAPSDYTVYDVKQQCGLGQTVLLEDMYPCTPLQEGLMALSVSNTGSYVAHHALRLAGDIDMEAFRVAWEHTVDSSAILRTRIVPIHGTFMQAVFKNDFSWEDTTGLTIKQYLANAEKFRMGYGSKLSRYALLSPNCFVWTVHHAVVDGWSLSLLLDRVRKIYLRVQTPAIRPFSSFIKYTMEASDAASTAFWAEQLKGAIRTPFPETSIENYKPTASFSRIIRHGAPENSSITMATILRSAWSILLGSYCDTQDVCFCTTISGRQAPVDGIEFVEGPTLATVPVRIAIAGDETVGKFLKRVQDQSLDMIPHEQFGLQRIAKISQEARDACEFSSLMIIQPKRFGGNTTADDVIVGHLEGGSLDSVSDDYYTYPLMVQFALMESEIELHVLYAPELLSEFRITAISHQIEHVVGQLLGDSQKLVDTVSVSGPWDLEQSLNWNQEDQTPVETMTHEFFAENVARDPHHQAIYTTARTLTYAELDKMTTQMGAYLKTLGVGPEVIVPFCMEKSIWPSISMMAILKAGGAYMPLDPNHPFDYRQNLVKQSGSSFVLTSVDTAVLCEGISDNVIAVSDSLSCFQFDEEEAKEALLHNPPSLDNPVYVIFSSGSTGIPKGIVIEHRAYATSLLAHGDRLGYSRTSRVFQFANHVFDAVAQDILTTLAYGGTVCVPTEYERLHDNIRFLNESECDFMDMTPGFAKTIDPDLVPRVKTLSCGGEAMTKEVLDIYVNKVAIFDSYGPAEASVIATMHQYKSSDEFPGTVGKPARNGAWLVDPKHKDRLAPIGCEGELVLQGPTLARGYHQNPELTARQFTSNVGFLPQNVIDRSTRFYWTGDLMKYNDKGELLYLGRRDAQVKLRGQRIELGHIDTTIMAASDEIESAVVEFIGKGTPAAALVCFVKTTASSGNHDFDKHQLIQNNADLTSYFHELRGRLVGSLPSYMIPSYFIPLAVVPRNSSAKIDRKLLRHTAEALSTEELKKFLVSSRDTFCDVADDTERKIRDAWAIALRITAEDISTNDNFYEMGGDSISIITLLKRIQSDFGVHLGLSIMNSKNTTIAQMANFVKAETHDEETNVDVGADISSALSASWVSAVKNPLFVSNTSLPADASVFLTGGTGFLGTQLLRGLLAMDNVKRVVALVRAKSTEEGMERLKRTAKIAGWWNDDDEKRVEVWTGDLEETKLGLEEEQWAQISGTSTLAKIDAIIHNGAVVNWHADYEKLKNANVRSVLDLLQASVESRHQPRFVFVSGGVAVDMDGDPDTVAEEMHRSIGYCQTKYVAETVVYRLAAMLPSSQNRFSVIKPGMIIGTATEGVANLDDFLWRFVATAAKIQLYPKDAEPGFVAVSDGGLVASRTLDQITAGNIASYVNLSGEYGMRASDFWGQVNSELDTPCRPAEWNAWLEKALADMNQTGESHPLWPVQHFISTGGISGPEAVSAPDEEELGRAVRANVSYLKQVGFINSNNQTQVQINGEVLSRRGVPRK